jgi:outer membrane protein W
MKRGFAVPVVLGVLVCLGAGAPAQAQDVNFKIFGAAAYVSPLSNDDITIDTITDSVEASDQVGYNLGFEWRMSKLFGLEVDYIDAKHDIEFGSMTLGEANFQPLSATLNFHLIHGEVVDFYFGPTYSYVNWGDIDLNDDVAPGEPDVATDAENAYGISVGLDFGIGETFAIVAGLRYLQLDITPEDEDDGVAVDPLIARLGVALRF